MSKIKWFGLAAALALVGCSGADASDDGEQVGESEDHLLAGRRVSPSEVASLLRQAGFPASAIGKMVCTAKYESNFYERASNRNRNGSVDYGLFQINSIHFGDRGCPSNANALYNAATNARCAKAVFDMQGVNAWYGYKKHRAECDRYPAPGGSGVAPGPIDNNQDDVPLPPQRPDDMGNDQGAGGCWSGTLQEMVDANTCVESKYNMVWYQCHEGLWYRGVANGQGPYGACTSSHPIAGTDT
jgi:hypothetical protein